MTSCRARAGFLPATPSSPARPRAVRALSPIARVPRSPCDSLCEFRCVLLTPAEVRDLLLRPEVAEEHVRAVGRAVGRA